MKAHNRTNVMTGTTGEHFVAAELSKRGYIATITQRNTHSVDILASSRDGSRTVSIQVKTSSSCAKKWTLGPKAENLHSPKYFYVFVNLNNDEFYPDFHIVKSKVVAEYIKNSHKSWLKAAGVRGQTHNDSSIRIFVDDDCKYLDKWKSLGLET